MFESIFEGLAKLFIRICGMECTLFGVEFRVVSVYIFVGLLALGILFIKGLGDK